MRNAGQEPNAATLELLDTIDALRTRHAFDALDADALADIRKKIDVWRETDMPRENCEELRKIQRADEWARDAQSRAATARLQARYENYANVEALAREPHDLAAALAKFARAVDGADPAAITLQAEPMPDAAALAAMTTDEVLRRRNQAASAIRKETSYGDAADALAAIKLDPAKVKKAIGILEDMQAKHDAAQAQNAAVRDAMQAELDRRAKMDQDFKPEGIDALNRRLAALEKMLADKLAD